MSFKGGRVAPMSAGVENERGSFAQLGRCTKSAVSRNRVNSTDLLQGFTVAHDRVPGRLRVQVAGLFRNRKAAVDLQARLMSIEDMTFAKVSIHTGRLLVHFDKGCSHKSIIERIGVALSQFEDAPPAASNTLLKRGIPLSANVHGSRSTGFLSAGLSTPASHVPQSQQSPATYADDSAGIHWHTMSVEAIAAEFGCDHQRGLSSYEIRRRQSEHGPNKTPGRPPSSTLAVFGRQFNSMPVAMLIGASAVSIMTGGVVDALVTLAVVSTNAAIGFSTEINSERIIRDMTARQTFSVPLLRDGEERLVPFEQIVPGDILILRPNQVIAADARVVEADALLVNEALLTGESEPTEKSASHLCSREEALSNRRNMVFSGSFVASGSGRAIVIATGARTESGQMEEAAAGIDTPRTPLERDLEDLGGKLATLSLLACGGFFVAGYLRGQPLMSMLKSSIALAVAAVPEGLPATATTTLALGLRELKRRGVITRRLEAVESLGALQVLCFDKTGTLTQNKMRVEKLHLGPDGRAVAWDQVEARDAVLERRLLEIGTLCSEVKIDRTQNGFVAHGTPTEAAIVRRAIEIGLDPEDLRASQPLKRLEYRTESARYMTSFHGAARSRRTFVAVKGDPGQVLRKCGRIMEPGGGVVPLTEGAKRSIARVNDDLAGKGLRVLGFAFAECAGQKPEASELTWVGAAGLKDPIARGAKELIGKLQQAGIRPIMITGDQAATAEAIAREIGLAEDGELRVLDSTALERLRPELLSALAVRTHVFARVPPTKKLRIIEALQRAGFTVGMTGDGFNDAPALKAANVAIAVGRDTASVARDVADVIVAADDLTVIADGVAQGRTILSNIRKAVHYLISTNLSEILVLIAESLNHNDQLETPAELLWLNLVTDIFPALGLAMEPPERLIMTRPPPDTGKTILTVADLRHSAVESMVISGGVLGAHGYGLLKYGPGPQTRAVTFMSLVSSQLLHALSCRHDRFEPLGGRALFGNPALNAALIGSAALQALPIISPTLRRLLGIGLPTPVDLAVAGISGIASFLANETIHARRSS